MGRGKEREGEPDIEGELRQSNHLDRKRKRWRRIRKNQRTEKQKVLFGGEEERRKRMSIAGKKRETMEKERKKEIFGVERQSEI
mgnify:FL=1